LDDAAGEPLPALAPVGVGLPAPHRQHGVEQQDALASPVLQAAVVRDRAADVLVELLEDVWQRRRRRDPGLHRKAQAVSLSRPVVRVLAQDHHFGIGVGRVVKGVENVVHVGVDRVAAVLLDQERPERLVVGLLELVRQQLGPVVLEHRRHLSHSPMPNSSRIWNMTLARRFLAAVEPPHRPRRSAIPFLEATGAKPRGCTEPAQGFCSQGTKRHGSAETSMHGAWSDGTAREDHGLDLATRIMEALGYPGIILVVAAENLFPPIPSEVVLPFAGFMTTASSLTIPGVIAAATAGSLLGALILYGLGAAFGAERIERFVDRYQRYLTITPEHMRQARAWFARYGVYTVFF